MSEPLIRTFSYHYRQKYRCPVGKIPVDMGQPCPNRLRGGCIYCRPASFTPSYLSSNDTLLRQVAEGKKHLAKGRFVKYFAYFQQETCTAIPAPELLAAFELLLLDDDCLGLIISTRPDYIDYQFLLSLAELMGNCGKECLFELGVQSVHEKSLKLLNRNHSFKDFQDSCHLIKEVGCFELGAHLIFGIPGETEEEMLSSVRTVCQLEVNALKLHHLQVIADTPLHNLYQQGKVASFTLAEYLEFLLKILPLIPPQVTVHRLWATSHPDLLIAPKWNVLASKLSRTLQDMMADREVWQGKLVE